MARKYEIPESLQTALDCAIRKKELKEGKVAECGYKLKNGITYCNYISNKDWDSYLNKMPSTHKEQYGLGAGGELKAGKYPPKMASFGSSSRFVYELSNENFDGFHFEKKLDTRVGGIAHLDGFIQKGNKYIYVEAKRREIYYSSHKKIKDVYRAVYEAIQGKYNENECGYKKESFGYKMDEQVDKDGYAKCTFYFNGNPVHYFDLKQLICHFLGITYDLAKNNVKDAEVKFVYLIYNPDEVKNNIEEKYKGRVKDRYKATVKFIENEKNKQIIKDIFNAVLEYQKKTQGYSDFKIKNFEFVLVDQGSYKDRLNNYLKK